MKGKTYTQVPVRLPVTTGTVVRFNGEKGFGFIKTDAIDEDVFFHVRDIDGREPREGQELEFVIKQAEKGPRADRIRYKGLDTRAL